MTPADLAAARREAEEALREWGVENERANSERRQMALYACAKALRSLLAATPEPAYALPEASVLGWAMLAVALLQRHSSAWEHDPGPGDEDCDEDCRACEYEALLRTGKAALASRGGRS